ncbi:MAG TPA: DUF3239 domain-containing protein [Candidatus Paceibacterota bacterium]|nr:DUF3239 domain-containing protein [Candidatus Paceibacterota bacterium]
MRTLKVQCPCGQKFSFDVEPVDGQMPFAVNCPSCGADATAIANQSLAESDAKMRNFLKTFGQPVGPLIEPSTEFLTKSEIAHEAALRARAQQQLTAEEVKSGAWASNPGRLHADWAQVFRAWPAYWQVPLVIAVVSAVAGFWNPYLFLGLALAAWSFWDSFREVSALLMNGDLCPSIVLSERPPRVAVLTNLSARGEKHPVVKILEQPIFKAAGGPLRAGARCVSIAFYAGPITSGGDWKNFGPMLVNTLVSKPAEIQRVQNSIPESDWFELSSHIARLPSQKEGLYAMWGPQASRVGTNSSGNLWGFRWVLFLLIGIAIVSAIAIPTLLKSVRRNQNSTIRQSPGNPRHSEPEAGSTPTMDRFNQHTVPRPSLPGENRTGFAGIAVGDKVDVLDIRTGRWSPGSVVEYDGIRFRVRMDDGTADQWMMRGQLRPRR